MKCQACGERDASIHYVEIVEGQKTSQWVCSQCAEKEGITPAETTPLVHGTLEVFLGGMLSAGPSESAPEETEQTPPCDVCGYEYAQLKQTGLLGCPACYAAFRRHLLPMLRRYHGDVNHLGKLPRSHGPRASMHREIARMKLMLEQAVTQENYEDAARIRDEIRVQERQLEILQDEPSQSTKDAQVSGDAFDRGSDSGQE